jgi:type III pantothenate kinase
MKTGLRMRYRTPETLGADRLCAATAAFARYGGPVIVVDMGTATTVDCVTRTGEYLGGAISPGIETSARALHARAAQLPMIDLVLPEQIVGRDTRSSLQTGVILGAIAAMEGLVEKFRHSAGRGATVVATGGFAPLVATQSRVLDIINPHLVLEGAALIWMKHRGGIKRTG